MVIQLSIRSEAPGFTSSVPRRLPVPTQHRGLCLRAVLRPRSSSDRTATGVTCSVCPEVLHWPVCLSSSHWRNATLVNTRACCCVLRTSSNNLVQHRHFVPCASRFVFDASIRWLMLLMICGAFYLLYPIPRRPVPSLPHITARPCFFSSPSPRRQGRLHSFLPCG